MKSELNRLKKMDLGFFPCVCTVVVLKKPQQINSERNRNIYNLRKIMAIFSILSIVSFLSSSFCCYLKEADRTINLIIFLA